MTLDLTTFILQILNFLVLLWLLHRFVYGPLRAAIAKRLADAQAAEAAYQAKLDALEQQRLALEQQRAGIQAERQQAEAALAEDMARERSSRLNALEKELLATRERGATKLEAQLAEREARSSQQLQKQVDTILRQHLQRLANPALETVLLNRFIDDAQQLAPEQISELRQLPWSDPVDIITAFPVSADQQGRILTALSGLSGQSVRANWKQDARLLAGIRIGLDGREIEFGLNSALRLLPELISRETDMQAAP